MQPKKVIIEILIFTIYTYNIMINKLICINQKVEVIKINLFNLTQIILKKQINNLYEYSYSIQRACEQSEIRVGRSPGGGGFLVHRLVSGARKIN